VVEVSVDVETARESIVERKFDPQGRVAISQETRETTNSATDAAGDVTVASNLPDGAAAGDAGKSQSSETRETVNFEVSETQREVLRTPGALRRISVAVLVDGLQVTAEDGTSTWQPRPEEELAVLRELVASAVGLDETRGDVLTLRSLAFEPVVTQGTLAESGMFASLGSLDLMAMAQLLVLSLVALVLGLFVIRPALTSPVRRLPELAAAPPLALTGMTDNPRRVLNGEIDDGTDLPQLSVVSRDEGDEPPDPVARLRLLIAERQVESVEILRGWMDLEEEKT
jgi:flagellar M-ring protein FliF